MTTKRARKIQETYERIAVTALHLFLEDGYEQTTVDMIADAAEISRRTFFHYFESKEAIFEAVHMGIEGEFRSELSLLPMTLAPVDAVRLMLRPIIERWYQSEQGIALDHLMSSTNNLRARRQAHYESREMALATILRERWPAENRKYALQMIAILGIGALRVAIERWNSSSRSLPIAAYFEMAFDEFKAEMQM